MPWDLPSVLDYLFLHPVPRGPHSSWVPAEGNMGNPWQTPSWKCSLGWRSRGRVEPASPGPAEVSEEAAACSPGRLTPQARIWAISLFFSH